MSGQIYLDDLDDCELVILNSKGGLAANSKSNKLIIFKRINREWISQCFDLSDVSRVENITSSPDKLFGTSGRGLHSAGEGVGTALHNAFHKSKSKRQTGIKIHFRSLDIPSVFLNMPIDTQRLSAFEGLNQFLDGGHVSGKLHQVPLHVRGELKRPTASEINRRQRRQSAFALSTKMGLILFGLAGLATLATLAVLLQQGTLHLANTTHLRSILGDVIGETALILFVWLSVLYVATSSLRFLRASR